MQNPQISPAEWFRNAPSFIPAEEVKALKERAAEHMKREREEALRRAAELDADLRALSGEPEPQVEQEDEDEPEQQAQPVSALKAFAGRLPRPDSSWSNKALVTYFAKRNPGSRSSEFVKFVASFKPDVPEQTTKANVHDTLKTMKRDELVRVEGVRGDYQYYYQGGA